MKKPTKATTQTRIRRSPEYREEALRLADKVGIPTAAKQLGRNRSFRRILSRHNHAR